MGVCASPRMGVSAEKDVRGKLDAPPPPGSIKAIVRDVQKPERTVGADAGADRTPAEADGDGYGEAETPTRTLGEINGDAEEIALAEAQKLEDMVAEGTRTGTAVVAGVALAESARTQTPRSAEPSIEYYGADALKIWMDKNSVKEIEGVYYKVRSTTEGKSIIVQTQPPQGIL